MSSKAITKESRVRRAAQPHASEPIDIVKVEDVIIESFPTGRPKVNLTIPSIIDKSEALEKYTDRNSMLYTYHQMRRDECKSFSSLSSWEQILEDEE